MDHVVNNKRVVETLLDVVSRNGTNATTIS
jgi:hypothetical protein